LRGFRHAGQRQWNRYNISQLLGNEIPDVFIDIGANIGELSYYASALGIKKIISVEPDPVVCEILKFNLRDTNAIICEKAISLQEGSVSLFLAPYTADSSLIEPATGTKKVSVKSLTLKSLLSELDTSLNVLLKIDAEGYEPEILQSGIGALSSIKYISVDVSPERGGTSTSREVESILNMHDFDVNRAKGNIVTATRKVFK
jgi:FkbM family methyltransferase